MENAQTHPTAVLVHLSGDLRGARQVLRRGTLRIGTAPEADVRLRAHESSVGADHAELVHRGGGWELRVAPGRAVWVNGDKVETRWLESGDVLEIGPEGPVLRFRLYAPGSDAFKSPRQAFEDSLASARVRSPSFLGRAGRFLAGVPRELATQTTVRFRTLLAALLVVLVGGLVWVGVRGARVERRLGAESERLRAVAETVERERLGALDEADLRRLRDELEGQLEKTSARLRTLEARSDAPARILAAAAGSVAFLQGSYGFVDPASGRPFRLAGLDEKGRPRTDGDGHPLVTTEGDGPLLERQYTGTAFVVSAGGLLVTNRHVGLPWEKDDAAQAALQQGVKPALLRLVGWLPAVEKPFDVVVVGASDSSDLALLRGAVPPAARPLELREAAAHAGEEVLVLGYPAGIQALVARSDEALVKELMAHRNELDFWSLAQRLSKAGQIAPLATRGIVGLVTKTNVVYDAQTTFGGSGGPVLDLDGRVIAVNSAILSGFGGSNMGVPAAEVERLLAGVAKPAPE